MERVIWIGSRRNPINFAVTARLDGHLDLGRLRSALDRLTPARPLLRSRIEESSGRARFVFEGVPDFPVRVVANANEDSWMSVLREELLTPFPWETGPLTRFALVHRGDGTDLVVCCHHCVADGLSAAYVLRDVLRLVADPAARLDVAQVPQSMADAIPREARTFSIRAGLLLARLASVVGVPALRVAARVGRRGGQRDGRLPGDGLRILAWVLDPESTDRLTQRSRAEKTTVHAALCAAFLMAFADRERSRLRAVSSPVNLRLRLSPPVGDDFGLFICLAKISINVSAGGFWEVARQIKAKLNRASLWWGPLFAEDALGWRSNSQISRLMDELGSPPIGYDLSITNLGRLDLPERAANLRLRAVHGPAVFGVEDERILGVSTAAGRMAFVFTFPEHNLSSDAADQIRAAALTRLKDACSS